MKVKTYLDSNILIAAFRGDDKTSRLALEILDDPNREFVVSDYLRLEILPKPSYYRREEEIAFMKTVLDNSVQTVESTLELTTEAIQFASRYDLSPMDALHVASAFIGDVDELITLEKSTSPLCRVKEIQIVSINPSRQE